MNAPPLDAPALAHAYRRLVLWFAAQLVLIPLALPLNALPHPSPGTSLLALAILVVSFGASVALAFYAYRTAAALSSSAAVLWAIGMFLPCVGVLVLLALSAIATRACKAHGIRVGWLGPELPAEPTETASPFS